MGYKPAVCKRKLEICVFHNQYVKDYEKASINDGAMHYSETHISSYSILRNEWIAKPQKYDAFVIRAMRRQANQNMAEIKKCASLIIRKNRGAAAALKLIDLIKYDRKQERGASVYKDYGPYNMAFRTIKRKGLIRRLKKYARRNLLKLFAA
jgi:hypothetical protein